jgi:integrase
MALTALQVKNAKPGEKLGDSGGLRLDVDRNGNKSWIFRFTSPVTGKERFMGLGPLADVTLAAARDAAQDARALIREGRDPIEHRNEQRTAAKVEASRGVTFKTYSEQFITLREAGWKNPDHRRQWRNSLRDHAYPHIGHMAVADIDTEAVLSVLRPIWATMPDTASRVRGRIEAILSAAKVEEKRTGPNPALWRGHLSVLLPSKKKVRSVEHHPALAFADMPRFFASLCADTSDAAWLLRFIIATAARYSEAALADWREIKGSLWTVPIARMKTRPHAVPLSDAAMATLEIARERYGDSGLIFPGASGGRPISDVSLAKCIKRHTAEPATTHGFRSTFRDWTGDKTDFPREVAEAALSHAVGNETELAYRRGTALEKRRALMQAWSDYCMSENKC